MKKKGVNIDVTDNRYGRTVHTAPNLLKWDKNKMIMNDFLYCVVSDILTRHNHERTQFNIVN